MTTGHNNTVSTHRAHFTYMPLTHTHTTTRLHCPLPVTEQYKNPRRDNIAGNRPESSGDINNEDPKAAHKHHIYCLLPVPPNLAACITAPRQDQHGTTYNIVPNIYYILYPMLQHSQQTNHWKPIEAI